MLFLPQRASRALAAAGLAAGLIGTLALATNCAAQAGSAAASPQEVTAQQFAKHVQTQTPLDQLAARLQIKASQEPAWQAFAAAFADAMTAHPAGARSTNMAEPDAASVARAHAERAAGHAQRLARMADATAKLQQDLSADQRQVLNEVARHFAHEHFERVGMARGAMGYGGYREHQGADCGRTDDAHGHGRWEHGGSMGAPSDGDQPKSGAQS